jgi:hypothetical protein
MENRSQLQLLSKLVLRIRILDSGAYLTLESGMAINPDAGSGMNIPDLIFENLILVFWVKILKFFDVD